MVIIFIGLAQMTGSDPPGSPRQLANLCQSVPECQVRKSRNSDNDPQFVPGDDGGESQSHNGYAELGAGNLRGRRETGT
jgi:hypothetical protein